MTKMEFKEEKHRFVLLDGTKEIGEMTWLDRDSYFIVNHTLVDSDYRGQGLAGKLVEKGVEKARREGRKLYPLCPFALKEFDSKPEYSDVRQFEL